MAVLGTFKLALWGNYDSPQMRRLRSDAAAMERLRDESSIVRFRSSGNPAQRYVIEFEGKSLTREGGKVGFRTRHQVEIKLGASYPRSMPEIRWVTPIFHPNISEIGMVCLGGYGTHWVPSLKLDALCVMLWDMARYFNYDVRSPYNRDAALWVANQRKFTFPIDARPLRDVRATLGRIETASERPTAAQQAPEPANVAAAPEPEPEQAVAEPERGEPVAFVIEDTALTPMPIADAVVPVARDSSNEDILFITD